MIKQGERSLSLALYNMNLKSEGPFSSSAYILNCNSTTKKKERKKIDKINASSSGSIVPIAISKEVKVLFSSLIFHFIFCNDYLKIKQFCENTFCHSDVLFLMTFAMLWTFKTSKTLSEPLKSFKKWSYHFLPIFIPQSTAVLQTGTWPTWRTANKQYKCIETVHWCVLLVNVEHWRYDDDFRNEYTE